MANLAKFTINATASSPGGFDATINQVLTLGLEGGPSSQAQRWTVQVYDAADAGSPAASKSAPTLSLVGATTGQKVDAVTPGSSVTVTMPSSGVHSWIIRSLLNGGLDSKGKPSADYVYERIVSIKTGSGLRKVIYAESTQYGPRGWADAQNDLIDAGAGPLTAPGGVADANKLAAASGAGTNLQYAAGIKLASGGTALAYGGAVANTGFHRLPINPGTFAAYLAHDGATTRNLIQAAGDGSTFTDVHVADDDATTGNSALYLKAKGFAQFNLKGFGWLGLDLVGGGGNEPRLTFKASNSSPTAWMVHELNAAATDTTRRALNIQGQDKTGNTSTKGGTVSMRAGSALGAGGTMIGGWLSLAGGSAPGASGTRNGGDVSIFGGTGGTRYGNVFFGTDFDPDAFNWQSMGRGIGVQDAQAAPTGDNAIGHFYWSDGGRPMWRFLGNRLRLDGTAGTATAGGAALPGAPVGFLVVQLNGSTAKIPYYAN